MKQSIKFLKNLALLLCFNCLVFNPLASGQSYACNILAPDNFLAATNAAGNVVTLRWQNTSQATGGYRIEVFDISTARRHFESNLAAGAVMATVSTTPGHRYFCTIRSICGTGASARLSLKPNTATADKIIVDDVIIMPCINPCPGGVNADYPNLAGQALSWQGAIWPPAVAVAAQLTRRMLYLQIRPPAGAGEKIRLIRDDGNKMNITFRGALSGSDDICRNAANMDCFIDAAQRIVCNANGAIVAQIDFGMDDAITFSHLGAGYQIRYRTDYCSLQNFNNFNDPNDGGQQRAASPEQPSSTPLSRNLACSPNPASDWVDIGFELLDDDEISLEIITSFGEKVADVAEKQLHWAGSHQRRFASAALPPGVYFAVLRGKDWQSAVAFEKL